MQRSRLGGDTRETGLEGENLLPCSPGLRGEEPANLEEYQFVKISRTETVTLTSELQDCGLLGLYPPRGPVHKGSSSAADPHQIPSCPQPCAHESWLQRKVRSPGKCGVLLERTPALRLKHCEDPVVIEDGDGPGPQDLEQERMSAESQSNPDAQPVALAQGLGLLSRPPGQPTEDPIPQDVFLVQEPSIRDAQPVTTCQLPPSRVSPFKDMILCFSEEDWSLLDPAQTGFYGEFIIGEDYGVSMPPNDLAAQPAQPSPEEENGSRVTEMADLQGKDAPQISCLDLPSLQPFQEEGRKWEELQVPELQSCQQGALTQSPSPGGDPPPLKSSLDQEVTIEIVLSSSGDEDSQHSPYCTEELRSPTEKPHSLPTHRGSTEVGGEVQTSQKSYMCPSCGKSFRWRVNFIRHMRSRREQKPHKCSVCGELFSDSEDLDGHLETHEVQKPYRCTICGKSFRLNSHLLSHRRIIHLQPDRQQPVKKSEEDASETEGTGAQALMEKSKAKLGFQCGNCGKSFQRHDHLVRHRSHCHLKSETLQCRYCVKTFRQNYDLLRHERIHMKRRSKQALNSY
ncbi:zinc finger protein 496 isoform X5 [Peromyscus leucopus]|uniref:zinc finger protein 496 isoform X5 n=1 Tax=Peromyscus leucopus TaxID=10041 RepID=UPI001884B7E9|nr:zinc finger protein 496 isoform X5 [Peromyscus leucopus]